MLLLQVPILENDKSKKVIYVTSETFTNEIVDAVRDSKNEHSTARQEFRNKYRNVDVLLIDDIQFIIGKESTWVISISWFFSYFK